MRYIFFAFLLIFQCTGLHSEEVENFYTLPNDMNLSVPLEMFSESAELLNGNVSKNWTLFPLDEKNRLYSYHYKPSIKFNVETGNVYYWDMMIVWKSATKGDLKSFFPPFLLELDCKGERARSIAYFDLDGDVKEIVKVKVVPWVKLEERLKINYCVDLNARKIKEIEKLKKGKEQQDRKLKSLM